MPPSDIGTPPADAPPLTEAKQTYPVLTWVACAACIGVFIGISLEDDTKTWATLSKWGYFPVNQIRDGAFWGIFTSALVHLEIWHLAFNLYWLYLLGGRLERAIGSTRWLAFFLSSAVVSAAAEITFAGTTGIGASGVVYAFFGFMWVARKRFLDFQTILNRRTIILFLAWLVGCVFLTLSHVWNVGNAAHVSGLLFGMGCGAWMSFEPRRRLINTALALLVLGSSIGLFWAPWSLDWTSWRGTRAYRKADFKNAIYWYERSLQLGQEKVWCWQGLALCYFGLDDSSHYQTALNTLRSFDETAAKNIESQVTAWKKH